MSEEKKKEAVRELCRTAPLWIGAEQVYLAAEAQASKLLERHQFEGLPPEARKSLTVAVLVTAIMRAAVEDADPVKTLDEVADKLRRTPFGDRDGLGGLGGLSS